MSTTDLRELLERRIDDITPPAGDLAGARTTGRRIRRRRRTVTGTVAAAAVVAVGATALAVGTGTDDGGPAGADRTGDDAQYAALGALDFSNGARAYGETSGRFIHLGGRRFPARDLEWLDTDAVATSEGVVFYDRGRPMLLEPSGDFSVLDDAPITRADAFHPTAKADGSVVAWATLHDGTATITVHDLATGEDVASTDADCTGCRDLVIDAIDDGVVFVRDGDGTRTWDSATGEWADFAGPRTSVADVRNGVVLYDGPAPAEPGDWRLVAGAIDAQLTFDGGHVLSWSSTLAPTTPDGAPIVLPEGGAAGQWNIDSDGSILVFAYHDGGTTSLHDCEVPSGDCEELPVPEGDADVMFIGNDM